MFTSLNREVDSITQLHKSRNFICLCGLKDWISFSSSDEEDKTSKHETRRETQLTEAWRLLVRRRDGLHTLLSREEIYHLQDNYNGDAVDEQRTSLRAVFPTIRSIDSSPDLSSRSK